MLRLLRLLLVFLLVPFATLALSFPKPSGDPVKWAIDETRDYCFWGAGSTQMIQQPNGVIRYERGDLDCYAAMDANNIPEFGGDNDEGEGDE